MGSRTALAEQLGIDPEKVRVVSPFVGGAFGAKGSLTPRTALIALAAKRLNRPVKLVATPRPGIHHRDLPRRDAAPCPARRQAATASSSATAMRAGRSQSRPDPYCVAGVEDSARLYAFGAVRTKVNIVHADRNTPGFMRSPPVVPYIYALESAMDELAVKLRMDPVELRRVNDTMTDPVNGKPYSSRSLMQCFDGRRTPSAGSGAIRAPARCATATGSSAGAARPRSIRPISAPATARVRLMPDGKVRVQTAAHEIGNGAYTVIGQMAAQELGVPLSATTVELGDTDLPPAPVAGGSNTTASTCSAVMKACDAIREKLFRAATTANDGPLAGRDPGQVVLRDIALTAPDGATESSRTRSGVSA